MSRVTCVSLVCLTLFASLLASSCAKDPELAKRAYVQSGDSYFANAKYREAIVQYRNAIQHDPQFGEARYKLAEAYIRINDAVGAYREYVRAADLMPENVEVQLKAGQALLAARRFDDAKARADRVLESNPENVQAHILRGTALAGLKDLDSAIAQVEDAIEIDPDRSGTYDNLGALQLAKGDRARAEEAFTRAVQIDGASVRARLALAIFYLLTRQAVEAEAAFKETLHLEATNLTANRALALIYLASRREPDAEPYLKTVATVSKAAPAQLALADYYMLTKRFADAVPVLNALSASDRSAYAAAQTRLASLDYARGERASAHRRLDDILHRDSKYSPALLLGARFLMAERRLDDAVIQATAATQADPTSAQAQFLLGKLQALTGRFDEAAKAFTEVLKLNPRAASAQMELSRAELADGKVDASIESARQVLKQRPDDPDAHLVLARGLIARREWAPAESEMKALLTKYPDVPAVLSGLGVLYQAKGDNAAAKRAFERALALDSRSLEALSGLVSLDLAAAKPADARTRVEATLAQNPGDVDRLLLAATTYAVSGDFARAEQPLRKVVTIDPANLQAHAMLGRLFLSEQELVQAKAEFETVAAGSADVRRKTAAQTMIALILEAQHRPSEAQRQYEQILAESPRSVAAANNLAWLYAENGGNLDVALGLAQTAAQQAADRPEVNDTLGWIYYKKDLPGQAIAALQRSVEKNSNNPTYHYHLGLAYAKSGNRALANQSLQKALALEPDFDGAAEARRLLAQ